MTWLFYALVAAVLISAAAILAKAGCKSSQPVISAGISVAAMFVCAFLMYGWNIKKLNIFSYGTRTLVFILIAGIITGAAILFFFKAIHSAEVIHVVPIIKINIIIFLWVSVFYWNNKVGTNLIVTTVLCVLGIVVLLAGNTKNWQWLLFSVLSSLLLTASSVVEKIGLSDIGDSSLRIYKLLIATVVIWIVAIASGSGKKLRSISFLDGIYSCLAGAAVIFSQIALSRADSLANNTTVLQVYRMNFLMTVIIASVILKEKISGRIIVGALFFIAGLEILLLKNPLF